MVGEGVDKRGAGRGGQVRSQFTQVAFQTVERAAKRGGQLYDFPPIPPASTTDVYSLRSVITDVVRVASVWLARCPKVSSRIIRLAPLRKVVHHHRARVRHKLTHKFVKKQHHSGEGAFWLILITVTCAPTFAALDRIFPAATITDV